MKKKINPKLLQDLEQRNLRPKKNNNKGPLLGLDYGTKFCGLAFSPDGICVFPLEVVKTIDISSRIKTILTTKK